jgi:voltage-gated potassium channel
MINFELLHAAFHQPESKIYRYVHSAIGVLIVISIALLAIESTSQDSDVMIGVVSNANYFIIFIFFIEFILRVLTYKPPQLQVFAYKPRTTITVHVSSRISYMLQPLMLVDALTLLTFLPELRSLRALRILRIFRALKSFRYKNPIDIVSSALEESGLMFSISLSILFGITLIGGLILYLIEVDQNPNVHTLLDGVWLALVTITTVGFGDVTPVTLLGRLISAGMMIAGLFSLALFSGVVGSSLMSGMLSLREEQFRMSDYVNHVIVCGYDNSTRLMMNVLSKELNLHQTKVVVIDMHERPHDLPSDIFWIQGDPTKISELDKVKLDQAASVIVSSDRDTTHQIADARTILITFTIRSYIAKHKKSFNVRLSPLYLVVEILDSENVGHALTAGANEVIETRKIGFSMIAHAVRYHGVGATMSRVLLSGSQNIYTGKIPSKLNKFMRYGDLLANIEIADKGGLVIGVRAPSGEEVINPDSDFLVEPDSDLFYLAKAPLLEAPA